MSPEPDSKKEREQAAIQQFKIKELETQLKYMEDLQTKMKIVLKENDDLKQQLDDNKLDKYNEFENKVEMLVQENMKLNQIIQQLQVRIGPQLDDSGKTLGLSLSGSKLVTPISHAVKNLRSMKPVLNLMQLKQDCEQWKQLPEAWERQLQLLLEEHETQAEQLEEKEKEVVDMREEIANQVSTQSETEIRVNQLIKENERLQGLILELKGAQEERDTYKSGFDNLEKKFETLLNENNQLNSQLNELMESRQNEDEQKKELFVGEQDQQHKQILEENLQLKNMIMAKETIDQESIMQIEQKMKLLADENDRLNDQIKQCEEVLKQKDQQCTEMTELIKLKEQQVQDLTEVNSKLPQFEELEQKIQLLIQENNRLAELDIDKTEKLKAIAQKQVPQNVLNKFEAAANNFELMSKIYEQSKSDYQAIQSVQEQKLSDLQELYNQCIENNRLQVREVDEENQQLRD